MFWIKKACWEYSQKVALGRKCFARQGPGAAFLAVETGAQIIPIGLDGFDKLFKTMATAIEDYNWRTDWAICNGIIGERTTQTRFDDIGNILMENIAQTIA